MNAVSVRWVLRMLTPNCTQFSEELLKRYRREPAKIYESPKVIFCMTCSGPCYYKKQIYYFNFILNRARSGRELFDHPSYITHVQNGRNIRVSAITVLCVWGLVVKTRREI